MPRSNSFCASGLHDVSKCTLPSLLSSVCPKAGRASETPVAAIAATANDVFFMIQLLVGLKTELGAVIAWSELERVWSFTILYRNSERTSQPRRTAGVPPAHEAGQRPCGANE